MGLFMARPSSFLVILSISLLEKGFGWLLLECLLLGKETEIESSERLSSSFCRLGAKLLSWDWGGLNSSWTSWWVRFLLWRYC